MVMKALLDDDAIRPRLKERLAPAGERRIPVQELVGVLERGVEREIDLEDDHGAV
jgi:hypothetical protein